MDSTTGCMPLLTSTRTPGNSNLYSTILKFYSVAIADEEIDLTHNLLDSSIGGKDKSRLPLAESPAFELPFSRTIK